MQWITIFFWSVRMFFPFYVIGAFIVNISWYFTRRWQVFPKVLVRSSLLAMLLAPGIAVGSGVAAIPAVLAVIADLTSHRADMGFEGFVPLLVVWTACIVILSGIELFTKKRSHDNAA